MIYYIFGSNKSEVIKTKAKKAIFVSKNLEETKDCFERYVKEIRYDHMYMIADYGVVGNKGIFNKQEIDPISHQEYIPFFIILEYHAGEDRTKLARADHTEIYHERGFTQKFENNMVAARCFENCVEAREEVKFTIHYKRLVRKNGPVEEYDCCYVRTIAETKDILRRMSLGLGLRYITRFRIEPLRWDFDPIKKISNFSIPIINQATNMIKPDSIHPYPLSAVNKRVQ